MFQLFKYFIFRINDPGLKFYDPLSDLLTDSATYLTWRRAEDDVPTDSVLYAGAIRDEMEKRWMIWRLTNNYRPGVEVWLDHQSKGQKSLGTYQSSLYRGLLASTPPAHHSDIPLESWYNHKLPQMLNFYVEYFGETLATLEGSLTHRRTTQLKWEWLHGNLVSSLKACGGVLTKRNSIIA